MSNGGANFRIIRDERAADPGPARKLLRSDDPQITRLVGLDMYVTEGDLKIPDDGALMMIGNTEELTRACEGATSQMIGRIATASRLPLIVHFVRMKISGWPRNQNDTLIVIGSQRYWDNVGSGPSAKWTELDVRVTSLSLYYDTSQNSLPRWIQSIKDNYGDPTVDKEGETL
jgi:hypothetical protein